MAVEDQAEGRRIGQRRGDDPLIGGMIFHPTYIARRNFSVRGGPPGRLTRLRGRSDTRRVGLPQLWDRERGGAQVLP
jgi:hypothetical protein